MYFLNKKVIILKSHDATGIYLGYSHLMIIIIMLDWELNAGIRRAHNREMTAKDMKTFAKKAKI